MTTVSVEANGEVQHTLTRDGQAHRFLHVTVGDSNWEPSQEEMQEIAELFLSASADSSGQAVVVTRTGVTAQYIEPEKA